MPNSIKFSCDICLKEKDYSDNFADIETPKVKVKYCLECFTAIPDRISFLENKLDILTMKLNDLQNKG